jgi:hypothetical protein
MTNNEKDGWNNFPTRDRAERELFTMLSRDTRFSVRRQSNVVTNEVGCSICQSVERDNIAYHNCTFN